MSAASSPHWAFGGASVTRPTGHIPVYLRNLPTAADGYAYQRISRLFLPLNTGRRCHRRRLQRVQIALFPLSKGDTGFPASRTRQPHAGFINRKPQPNVQASRKRGFYQSLGVILPRSTALLRCQYGCETWCPRCSWSDFRSNTDTSGAPPQPKTAIER